MFDSGSDGVGKEFTGVPESGALADAARALAVLDVQAWSDDECLGVLDDLEVAQRCVDAVRMDTGAEVDWRGMTMARFGQAAASWTASRHGRPVGACRRDVRTGQALRTTLPLVGAALRDGKLSASQAAVICDATTHRNTEAMQAAQDALVDLARASRVFGRFQDDVRSLGRHADADGGHDPRPEPERNRLSRRWVDDELQLDGVFVGELAVELDQVLDRETDRLFRRHRSDAARSDDLPTPGRNQLAAMALVDLVRRGHASDSSATRAPVVDVTLVISDHPPAGVPHDGGQPIWGRPRRCTDVSGIRFSDHTAELLTCDPVVHALLVDVEGVPQALATAARFATDDQRRAAAVRDGGCVFPGCDAPPSWTDLHHVVHAEDGGPTEMWNLASLCRRHHGVVHRTGWSVRTVGDQWFEVVSPSGAVMESQRHGRPRERPPEPA